MASLGEVSGRLQGPRHCYEHRFWSSVGDVDMVLSLVAAPGYLGVNYELDRKSRVNQMGRVSGFDWPCLEPVIFFGLGPVQDEMRGR